MKNKISLRKNLRIKSRMKFSFRMIQVSQILLNICIASNVAAENKTSVSSGNWTSSVCWSPAGIPQTGDNVTIHANHEIIVDGNQQIQNLVLENGGTMKIASGKSLQIAADFTVNGKADMNGGNISFINTSSHFTLGPGSEFIWNPGNNTFAGASLFNNGIENFSPSSTLSIRKWYDYSKALGESVTGIFGNIIVNTPGGTNSIVEWNQKNFFESHRITGKLTIEDGWITLDKSGSISSTQIGSIVLTSPNSSFIAHNGTHQSQFNLTTGTIINNGGKFYGINDGNGDINLTINGDFTNSGNVKIINNTGVSGVSNGNVQFHLNGKFFQTSGDTRLIYNVTTINSGYYKATFYEIILNGGIFMGQSACHTDYKINTLDISGNMTVSFQNINDKFRGTGITSIGQAINNAGLKINIGGKLTISGNENSEFTTSASSGNEWINVSGDVEINGCVNNFNYGTTSASHQVQFEIAGNMFIAGGKTNLSKNSGRLFSSVGKNLFLTGGKLIIKENSGIASVKLNGNFIQSGGLLLFHTNILPTNDQILLEVNGSFNQQGGIINYDDNPSGAEHCISFKGQYFKIGGSGQIIHARQGSTGTSGILRFEHTGMIKYNRSGNHLIDQVKQSIGQHCEVICENSQLMLSSYPLETTIPLTIIQGGKLLLTNSELISNGLLSTCQVYVESGGKLSIGDQSSLPTIGSASGNNQVRIKLNAESIVEYCGKNNQHISEISQAGDVNYCYGILSLNSTDEKNKFLLDDNILVRTKIELIKGSLKLNNHILTIQNGRPEAISRKKGYISSETDASDLNGKIHWQNISQGLHEFPFGKESYYLPLKFTPVSGFGNSVIVSSRQTAQNNQPCPFPVETSLPESFISELKVIDRWWQIEARNINADVSFTYASDENTISSLNRLQPICPVQWNGSSWEKLLAVTKRETPNTFSVSSRNVNIFSRFLIVTDDGFSFNQKSTNVNNSADIIMGYDMSPKIKSAGPNPFGETIKVNFISKTKSIVELTDTRGRIVKRIPIDPGEEEQSQTITGLSSLQSGIYFLSIISNGKKDTQKLIKYE